MFCLVSNYLGILRRYCVGWHLKILRITSALDEHLRKLSNMLPRYLYSATTSTGSLSGCSNGFCQLSLLAGKCHNHLFGVGWVQWEANIIASCDKEWNYSGTKVWFREQRKSNSVMSNFSQMTVRLAGLVVISVNFAEEWWEDTALQRPHGCLEDVRVCVVLTCSLSPSSSQPTGRWITQENRPARLWRLSSTVMFGSEWGFISKRKQITYEL